jgi:hypothetical protein
LLDKIEGLFVKGELSVRENLLHALQNLLHPQANSNMNVIETGFEVISDEIHIQHSDLSVWQDAKILFADTVYFAPDITPEEVGKLGRLIFKKEVFCRELLLAVLVQKCDRFKTRFVAYRDRIFSNSGQAEISKEFLNESESVAIHNHGVLKFSPSITAEEISKGLERVRNFGVIQLTTEQRAAVQAKLSNDGSGVIITGQSNFEDEKTDIDNIGTLKL